MIEWLKRRKQKIEERARDKKIERVVDLYLYFINAEDVNEGLLSRKIIEQPEVDRISTQTGFRNYVDITFSDGYELTNSGTRLMRGTLREAGIEMAQRLAEMYNLNIDWVDEEEDKTNG